MKALFSLLVAVLATAMASPHPSPNTAKSAESSPAANVTQKAAPLSERDRVLAVASGEVGVRELTGNNDGARVEAYLKAAHASKGAPYCAAFVAWCGWKALGAKSPYPASAWSPDMVAGGTAKVEQARGGDTFGIWSEEAGRVHHTGFIEKPVGKFFQTIEGNTSNAAALGSAEDREAGKGGGVYRKLRPMKTVKYIKSWLARQTGETAHPASNPQLALAA